MKTILVLLFTALLQLHAMLELNMRSFVIRADTAVLAVLQLVLPLNTSEEQEHVCAHIVLHPTAMDEMRPYGLK